MPKPAEDSSKICNLDGLYAIITRLEHTHLTLFELQMAAQSYPFEFSCVIRALNSPPPNTGLNLDPNAAPWTVRATDPHGQIVSFPLYERLEYFKAGRGLRNYSGGETLTEFFRNEARYGAARTEHLKCMQFLAQHGANGLKDSLAEYILTQGHCIEALLWLDDSHLTTEKVRQVFQDHYKKLSPHDTSRLQAWHRRVVLSFFLKDSQLELDLLSSWHAKGLLSGDRALVRPVDLAVHGAIACAKLLHSLGEPLGDYSCDPTVTHTFHHRYIRHIQSIDSQLPREPITALLMYANSSYITTDITPEVALGIEKMCQAYDWLKSKGYHPEEIANPTSAHNSAAILFGSLAYNSNPAYPLPQLAKPLLDRLLKDGVDVNKNGALHLHFASLLSTQYKLQKQGYPSENIEQIKENLLIIKTCGLDFTQHAPQSLTGIALSIEQHAASLVLKELIGLGVDPKKVPDEAHTLKSGVPVMAIFMQNLAHAGWELVKLGAPLATENEDHETLLFHWAQSLSKVNTASLAAGLQDASLVAKIDYQSKNPEHLEQTALHLACFKMNIQAIELLLKAGANPNLKDAKGWTPLRHLLRSYGAKAHEKIAPAIALLLHHGANPSIKDLAGKTPLQSVAAKVPQPALEALLKNQTSNDFFDGSEHAQKALNVLKKRSGNMYATVEQSEINKAVDSALTAPPTPSTAPKKTRTRL